METKHLPFGNTFSGVKYEATCMKPLDCPAKRLHSGTEFVSAINYKWNPVNPVTKTSQNSSCINRIGEFKGFFLKKMTV